MMPSSQWLQKCCTHKRWKPTYNAYAYKPSFRLNCIFCDIPMQYRHGTILPGYEGMSIAYKCLGKSVEKPCGFFLRFFIKGDVDYLRDVVEKYRGGHFFWVPTEEFEENEVIKQRLKDLGYF